MSVGPRSDKVCERGPDKLHLKCNGIESITWRSRGQKIYDVAMFALRKVLVAYAKIFPCIDGVGNRF